MVYSFIEKLNRWWVQEEWEDSVLKYVRETREEKLNGLEHARRECKETLLTWLSSIDTDN